MPTPIKMMETTMLVIRFAHLSIFKGVDWIQYFLEYYLPPYMA